MEVIPTIVDIRTRAYLSCGVHFDIRNIRSKECFFDKGEHWISYTRASVSHGERLKGLRSYKSARIQRQRTTRQPMFVIPLVDIENRLGSTNFPPFNSGLCKASSGSARFGDRLDPHCVGSGAREYWTDKLTCDYVYAKILAPSQPIRFLDWEEEVPNAP
jgi:hypothetical protein